MDASRLDALLIDTWWYGLSRRLPEKDFLSLAEQRAAEGFNAVQLVAGIPPEVGPAHPEAASAAGPAWNLRGEINPAYLDLARRRIGQLNALGLRVIVYGAWGMQIDWLGADFMTRWWRALTAALDDLDVIYCLTGEADLWLHTPRLLLPDRSTDDLLGDPATPGGGLRRLAARAAGRALHLRRQLLGQRAAARRARAWGSVLAALRTMTDHPLLVHVSGAPGQHSHVAVTHAEHLAARTVQTGHDRASRDLHWQLPLRHRADGALRFINLEPWYEGIRDDFGPRDQLYALWCTLLAGACSAAYGAQGVWNAGDGRFLAHWGRQGLAEARALPTPALLGRSHRYWRDTLGWDPAAESTADTGDGALLALARRGARGRLVFYPAVERVGQVVGGQCFDPLTGAVCRRPPAAGPLVVWQATG